MIAELGGKKIVRNKLTGKYGRKVFGTNRQDQEKNSAQKYKCICVTSGLNIVLLLWDT